MFIVHGQARRAFPAEFQRGVCGALAVGDEPLHDRPATPGPSVQGRSSPKRRGKEGGSGTQGHLPLGNKTVASPVDGVLPPRMLAVQPTPPAQSLTLPSTGTPTAFNSQFLITVLAQLLVLLLSFIIKGPVSVF